MSQQVPLDYEAPPGPRPWPARLAGVASGAGKKEVAIGALLLLVCAVISVLNPRFLSPINLHNQAQLVGLSGIYAIGMGVVIITGGIDLSVGSAFALQAVLLAIMLRDWHWRWPLAALASIGLMVGLGLAHALFITRVRLQPFIVTLCGLMFYRSMARTITADNTVGFGETDVGLLRPLAAGGIGRVPMAFVWLVLVAAVMWVVLHRSVYGRYLFAVGRNEEAARYSGIRTRLVIGSAYIVSMLLAGISGIIFAFYATSISPSTHGENYELYGIAAAVLGGCSLRGGEGSILGIVLGTVLLQVLRNMVILVGIPSSLELAVTATVILIGVTADQLLGRRRAADKPLPGLADSLPAPQVANPA